MALEARIRELGSRHQSLEDAALEHVFADSDHDED